MFGNLFFNKTEEPVIADFDMTSSQIKKKSIEVPDLQSYDRIKESTQQLKLTRAIPQLFK